MKNIFLLICVIAMASMTILTISCTENKSTGASTNDVPQLLDRGERIQLGKEWDAVQNHYMAQKASLNYEPNNLEAKLSLAELFAREARVTGEHGHYYPAALQMTDEILNTHASDSDLQFRTLITKAGVLLSLHEFEAAKAIGLQAYKLNPQNAQVNGVLVDAFVELGEYDKAVAASDRMIAIKPDLRSYSRVSYLREIHGDIEGAIEAMNYAVEAGYPGYEETAWAMLTLGNLYKEYGKLEKAESIYKQILLTREDYPFAHGEIADLFYRKGELGEAEEILDEAIQIIPEVGFYTQLAQIYKDHNRTQEFDEIMKEVFLMLEDDVVNGHNMNLEYADIYLRLMEDVEKAYAHAVKEYENRPKNIDVNRVMAEVLLHRGEIKKAKDYLIAASVTNSKNSDLQNLKEQIGFSEGLSSISSGLKE